MEQPRAGATARALISVRMTGRPDRCPTDVQGCLVPLDSADLAKLNLALARIRQDVQICSVGLGGPPYTTWPFSEADACAQPGA